MSRPTTTVTITTTSTSFSSSDATNPSVPVETTSTLISSLDSSEDGSLKTEDNPSATRDHNSQPASSSTLDSMASNGENASESLVPSDSGPNTTRDLGSLTVSTLTTTIIGSSAMITVPATIAIQPTNTIETDAAAMLSPLEITGIGIGAGIRGGLLTLLTIILLYCLYRRRFKRQEGSEFRSFGPRDDILSVSTEVAPIPTMTERKASTLDPQQQSAAAIRIDLLPPLPDHHLIALLFNLRSTIKTHIERFYTTSHQTLSPLPSSGPSSFEKLASVLAKDKDAPLEAGAMNTLLRDSSTRMPAIRMLITRIILRNIEISAPLEQTLLPPELVRMSATTADRHTTASLLAPIYTKPRLDGLDALDPRRSNIGNLTTDLVLILQPYVLAGFGASRVKDLERVVTQGAQFGYTLFSQPKTFRFDWTAGNGWTDQVAVVFPALVKVGDGKNEGRICQAETMRLDVRRS